MSAISEAKNDPGPQAPEDDAANGGGGDGSDSGNSGSAIKVYAMHGLLLSGIELALTVGNAVNREAFQLNSFSDLIFGGSVVIEVVGFALAMGMALRMLLYPMAQGLIGVGVPAMVIVEALAVAGSNGEMYSWSLWGLGAQSLCFLTFGLTSWIDYPASVPTASINLWLIMAAVCAALLFACYNRHQAGHSITLVVRTMFAAVPFVVEIAESALLFTSGSIPFVAYLLAVLDLVIIAPAASFVFLSAAVFLIEMLES